MAIFSKHIRPLPQLIEHLLRANSRTRTPFLALVLSLLILRSRLLSIPKNVITSLSTKVVGQQRATPEELSKALQQVYLTGPDGTKTLLVPVQDGGIDLVPIHPIPASRLASDAPYFPPLPTPVTSTQSDTKKPKPTAGRSFTKQLLSIITRIAIPSFTSKGALIVYLHTFFLVLRTLLSIAVARLDGRIVRDLVSADAKGFAAGLGLWFVLAIPSTYTNSMIRHLQSKLAFHIRTKLTRYTHDLYLSAAPDLRYYRAGSALEGIDQYLTADIEAFSEAVAGLYGNLAKPTLDMFLFTGQLSRSLGWRGTILLFVNYYTTVAILRSVTPAFGKLAAVEARLEGEYRGGMGRVGRDSEEVAFYDGGAREKDILTRAYMRLIKHVNSIYKIRIAYEWTEDYVIKYLWSAAGYGLIAVPLLITRKKAVAAQAPPTVLNKIDKAVADRTETYISNRRLLLSLADAGGRMMYAYKDILELAGLTTRLYTMISTLHNMQPLPVQYGPDDQIELSHVDVGVPIVGELTAEGEKEKSSSPPLVKDLSLVLKEGEHLMITGSNGVGKTAIARVIAGLWAPQGSPSSHPSVTRPRDADSIFIVPQRAYMVTGSLLDQIIYPHSYAQFVESGRTKEELMEILELVFLAYLPEREGGWWTRKEWRDVLSGGEKQRMGLARVFYHRPKFAVLDECTSAVSSDVEGRMYESAKALGITLLTVSLRPSLLKYHSQLLTITGNGTGAWELTRVGTAEERMGRDREIASLESKLAEVPEWEKRVKELDGLLSHQEV